MFGPASKTDYFSTFLDTVNAKPNSAADLAAAPKPSAPGGGLDAVMQHLLDANGTAKVQDLLPLTGYSLDGLSKVLGSLASLAFIKQADGEVRITASGKAVAEQRKTVMS